MRCFFFDLIFLSTSLWLPFCAAAARSQPSERNNATLKWAKHEIGDQYAPIYVYSADMDGDGQLDVLATSNDQRTDHPAEIAWYRNAGSGLAWEKHVIWGREDGVIRDVNGIVADDLDLDGILEVIVAAGPRQQDRGAVHVFSAHRDVQGTWDKTTILNSDSESFWKIYTIHANADDFPDIVAGGKASAKVLINPGNKRAAWDEHELSRGTGGCIFVGDVNSDQRPDLIHSNFWSQQVWWTEFSGLNGWHVPIDRQIASGIKKAFDVNLLDANDDSRPDVLVSAMFQPVIYWYEQPAISQGAWTQHIVTKSHTATDLAVGDINSDGRIDFAAASFGLPGNSEMPASLTWFERTSNNNSHESGWLQHWIDQDIRVPGDIEIRDLNKDGRPDLITSTLADNKVLWYENLGY